MFALAGRPRIIVRAGRDGRASARRVSLLHPLPSQARHDLRNGNTAAPRRRPGHAIACHIPVPDLAAVTSVLPSGGTAADLS